MQIQKRSVCCLICKKNGHLDEVAVALSEARKLEVNLNYRDVFFDENLNRCFPKSQVMFPATCRISKNMNSTFPEIKDLDMYFENTKGDRLKIREIFLKKSQNT